ncbi:zinc finger MYM-type protein 1-like, partial [Aphis craccivora]
RVYCETCWLFANRSEKGFKNNWIVGINDWHHMNEKINDHEKSQTHIYASSVRLHWSENKTINRHTEEQISKEADFWKNVLTRIIKIILYLTEGNTALRGNEGSGKNKSNSEGNFIRTVKLMSEFDPILYELLNNESLKTKYLSWKIQNEIIDLLAIELRRLLCEEIKASKLFSIIMDSTLDITKKDQLSVVLRYVVIDYQKKSIEIKESFLGFFELKKHGASDYENLLYNILESYDLNVKNCRGQGYDGASVMSGSNSGVQKRILSVAPNAPFVHCCAHNLNLVISDAAKSSQVANNFFATVQAIFNFFSSSAPRWATLAFSEDFACKIRKKVLKKICPTRWEARHESVSALKQRYIDVLKSLININLISKKSDERSEAQSLQKKMESFQFVLMLCVWENILRPLHGVSKMLQQQNMNLQYARDRLKDVYNLINELRNNYEDIINNAKSLCLRWSLPVSFTEPRQIYAKKHFDEVDGDRRLTITTENFKIKVFFPIIDTVLMQLNLRFKAMDNVCTTFDFLYPNNLLCLTEDNIVKESYDFIESYKDDISSDFTGQILSLKELIKNKNVKTINEMATFILTNDIATSYSDILVACTIFLTLPVTVATAERSFSKLKIIKNYLRNSCGQNRLTNIAILNIEQKRTSELKIDKLIKDFSNIKARKMKFV